MQRRIIYFSDIEPLNRAWSRQALLYWDAIGVINPVESRFCEYTKFYSDDACRLISAGALIPYSPDLLFGSDPTIVESFLSELTEKVDSTNFRAMTEAKRELHPVIGVYDLKLGLTSTRALGESDIGRTAFDILSERNIINPEREDGRYGPFHGIDHHAALLYMSLLAKYLAAQDEENLAVSGTGFSGCQMLSLLPGNAVKANLPVAELSLKSLPVPRPDVDVLKIVAFRNKHAKSS